ncbi:hypothetical protein D9M72_436650 [compost metagenome]
MVVRQHQLVAQLGLVAVFGQVLHMHPQVAVPLQVEEVHVAVQRHRLEARFHAGLAPERRIAAHLETAREPFLVIDAARRHAVRHARQFGRALGVERPRRPAGDKLRAKALLVAHEAPRVVLVLLPELGALLVEAELGQQLGNGAVGDVVARDHHRGGHAGAALVVVGQLGIGRLHGVGQQVYHHVGHALVGRHVAHAPYQPGQQHAVAVALVQPAIDGIARQVRHQPADQLVQPRDDARLRRIVDIVERQHLEHQRALVLALAQRVERVQRLRVEQLARHHHVAMAHAMLLQLPGQWRARADHGEQRVDQRFRNLEIHRTHSRWPCAPRGTPQRRFTAGRTRWPAPPPVGG